MKASSFNSAEMRLYYYPKGTNTVIVLPIGIGQFRQRHAYQLDHQS